MILHHHVAAAILGADIVERADIGVVQRGHSAGFALEAGAQIFALGDVFGQDFDGDGAVETGVASFVHLAHASRSNGGEDFIGTELVA